MPNGACSCGTNVERWGGLTGNIDAHCRYASSVILRVTYGKSSPTFNDDPEVVRIHKVLDNLQSALTPGTYLVDRIPWLKYVPGYARKLKQFRGYERELFRDQLNCVRNDMVRARFLLSWIRGSAVVWVHLAYAHVILGNRERWAVIWEDAPRAYR